jgi:hypothetical protein
MLTLDEMAVALGVHRSTVKQRAARGQLASEFVYNDKGQRLYLPPGDPVMISYGRCGKSIPERGKHGALQKYCGLTCRTAAYTQRRMAAGWFGPAADHPDHYAFTLDLIEQEQFGA